VREGETGWLNRSAGSEELAALMARAIDDPAEVVRLRRSVRAARDGLVTPMTVHADEIEAHYDAVIASQDVTARFDRRGDASDRQLSVRSPAA
jgi:hypothetical protein